MVENLCSNYGEEICSVEGVTFFSFPSIDRLQSEKGVEQKLRSLGFGYREVSPTRTMSTYKPTYYSSNLTAPCNDLAPPLLGGILSALFPSPFRAGYIAKAVAQISERGGDEYLAGLRRMKYHEARKELIGLSGIGPKVDK